MASDVSDVAAWELFATTYALAPYGPDGGRALHQLIERHIQQCMAESGFTYVEYPFMPQTAAAVSGRAMLPPLPSEADVQAYGYDAIRFLPDEFVLSDEVSDASERADEVRSVNDASAAENPQWDVALYGEESETSTERGGCIGVAYQAVKGGLELRALDEYGAIVPGLVEVTDKGLLVATTVEGDPLARALVRWQTCMLESGYDYKSPDASSAAFPGVIVNPDGSEYFAAGPQSEPTDEEIAVALADLRCRTASSFRGALRDALVNNIEEWYDTNAGAVQELRATIERERRALIDLAQELGVG